MNKKLTLSVAVLGLALLSQAPVMAQAFTPDKNSCRNNANVLRNNNTSLKTIDTKIAKANKALASIKKLYATASRNFDRSLARAASQSSDFGSQVAGLLGFAYRPEKADFLSAAKLKTQFDTNKVTYGAPKGWTDWQDGTLAEIYTPISADFGRGKATTATQFTSGAVKVSIDSLLDKIVGPDAAPPAVTDPSIAAARQKIMDKINDDLGPKVYSLLNKRAESIVKFMRSALVKKQSDTETAITTLNTTKTGLLQTRNNTLLPNARACEAAGIKF